MANEIFEYLEQEVANVTKQGKYVVTTYTDGSKMRFAKGTGEEEVYAETAESFEALVKAIGYDNTACFEKETGITCDELLKKWFIVMRDRVYMTE